MNKLNVSTSTDEETLATIVRAEGSLDGETVPHLRKVLVDLIEEGHCKLVIDMEKLSYISSAGVGAFIGVTKRVRQEKGDLIFVAPIPPVYNVLELLGLTKLFKIVDDCQKAIAEFQK